MKGCLSFALLTVVQFYLLGFISGCGNNPPPTAAEVSQNLAALPGLQGSHHAGLQNELARLVSEGATPLLLDPVVGESEADNKLRPAVALASLLSEGDLDTLREKTALIWPQGDFSLGPVVLQKAARLLEKHEEPLQAWRKALEQQGFQFRWPIRDGLLADTRIVDQGLEMNRLEGFAAAMALAEEDIERAVAHFTAMLLACRVMAAEKHTLPRLAAVNMRQEALQVLAAIVRHPHAGAQTEAILLARLIAELDTWPAEAQMWIGERAAALHTYEMIRDGRILSLMELEEIARLREEDSLRAFSKAAALGVDEDQAFYLTFMRELIAACEKPFYQRQQLWQDLDSKLAALRQTPHQPIVAERWLLGDLQKIQRRIAYDRWQVEAWTLALAETLGRQPIVDRLQVNPLTGEAYRVLKEPTRVVVEYGEQELSEKAVVPR